MCTHTDTEGKQRETRVRNILKFLGKTQYLMNTLYIMNYGRIQIQKILKSMNSSLIRHVEETDYTAVFPKGKKGLQKKSF